MAIVKEREGPGNGRQIGLSVVGEQQRAVQAAEQLAPQMLLQGLDLVADGGLGDVQLLCGTGEAQMACGSLEGAQGVQRGQASDHSSKYLINTNPKFKK